MSLAKDAIDYIRELHEDHPDTPTLSDVWHFPLGSAAALVSEHELLRRRLASMTALVRRMFVEDLPEVERDGETLPTMEDCEELVQEVGLAERLLSSPEGPIFWTVACDNFLTEPVTVAAVDAADAAIQVVRDMDARFNTGENAPSYEFAQVEDSCEVIVRPAPDGPALAFVVEGSMEPTYDAAPIACCRVCGCTENDCSQCIEKTGDACHWVEDDLCSACVDAAAGE